jgi:hypothetical protein
MRDNITATVQHEIATEDLKDTNLWLEGMHSPEATRHGDGMQPDVSAGIDRQPARSCGLLYGKAHMRFPLSPVSDDMPYEIMPSDEETRPCVRGDQHKAILSDEYPITSTQRRSPCQGVNAVVQSLVAQIDAAIQCLDV